MIPNVLTIAGSDSGGGAGIQADLKTFSALGTYGASVVTALTAQNTLGVTAIQDVPADFVEAQLDAVMADITFGAVKIGMLNRPEIIEVIARGLERWNVTKVVLDPVMVAKSGDKLLADDAVEALRRRLLPLATVVTPNLPEAGVLLGRDVAENEPAMVAAAAELRRLGPMSVLLKGGHLTGEESLDVFDDGGGVLRLAAARVASRNTHGTGCTLSAAIAAQLAGGLALRDAIRAAKRYITGAILCAEELNVGHGHGPVHHFHALWGRGESGGPPR